MKTRIFAAVVCLMICGCLLSSCKKEDMSDNKTFHGAEIPMADVPVAADSPETPVLPEDLKEIPDEYYSAAEEQGTLVELFYDTWESKTYAEKTPKLTKRAIVYLPYGYDESWTVKLKVQSRKTQKYDKIKERQREAKA